MFSTSYLVIFVSILVLGFSFFQWGLPLIEAIRRVGAPVGGGRSSRGASALDGDEFETQTACNRRFWVWIKILGAVIVVPPFFMGLLVAIGAPVWVYVLCLPIWGPGLVFLKLSIVDIPKTRGSIVERFGEFHRSVGRVGIQVFGAKTRRVIVWLKLEELRGRQTMDPEGQVIKEDIDYPLNVQTTDHSFGVEGNGLPCSDSPKGAKGIFQVEYENSNLKLRHYGSADAPKRFKNKFQDFLISFFGNLKISQVGQASLVISCWQIDPITGDVTVDKARQKVLPIGLEKLPETARLAAEDFCQAWIAAFGDQVISLGFEDVEPADSATVDAEEAVRQARLQNKANMALVEGKKALSLADSAGLEAVIKALPKGTIALGGDFLTTLGKDGKEK